jgi:hypothetical protein
MQATMAQKIKQKTICANSYKRKLKKHTPISTTQLKQHLKTNAQHSPYGSGTKYMCANAVQQHIYEGTAYRRIQLLGFAPMLMLRIK